MIVPQYNIPWTGIHSVFHTYSDWVGNLGQDWTTDGLVRKKSPYQGCRFCIHNPSLAGEGEFLDLIRVKKRSSHEEFNEVGLCRTVVENYTLLFCRRNFDSHPLRRCQFDISPTLSIH